MSKLAVIIHGAAVTVFLICVYAFLVGNGVFEGKFENDAIAWYFLAKGIFCSCALYLWVRVLAVLSERLPPRDSQSLAEGSPARIGPAPPRT